MLREVFPDISSLAQRGDDCRRDRQDISIGGNLRRDGFDYGDVAVFEADGVMSDTGRECGGNVGDTVIAFFIFVRRLHRQGDQGNAIADALATLLAAVKASLGCLTVDIQKAV